MQLHQIHHSHHTLLDQGCRSFGSHSLLNRNHLLQLVCFYKHPNANINSPWNEEVILPSVTHFQDKFLPEMCNSFDSAVVEVDHTKTKGQFVSKAIQRSRFELDVEILESTHTHKRERRLGVIIKLGGIQRIQFS